MLREKNWIIAAVNSCVAKTTHMYGIEVPHIVAEALKFDEINGNNLWNDSI